MRRKQTKWGRIIFYDKSRGDRLSCDGRNLSGNLLCLVNLFTQVKPIGFQHIGMCFRYNSKQFLKLAGGYLPESFSGIQLKHPSAQMYGEYAILYFKFSVRPSFRSKNEARYLYTASWEKIEWSQIGGTKAPLRKMATWHFSANSLLVQNL